MIDKIYQEKNKEKINERNSKTYKCDCGVQYTYGHKARHLKSKHHIDFVESQQ